MPQVPRNQTWQPDNHKPYTPIPSLKTLFSLLKEKCFFDLLITLSSEWTNLNWVPISQLKITNVWLCLTKAIIELVPRLKMSDRQTKAGNRDLNVCDAVPCHMLMLIFGTSRRTFVFMSMLKSHCLKVKMTRRFFLPHPLHHPCLWHLSLLSWFPGINCDTKGGYENMKVRVVSLCWQKF